MGSVFHGHMCNLAVCETYAGVVVFHRCMLNMGVCLPWVYEHSSICENLSVLVVFQRCMLNCMGVGHMLA